VTVEAVVTLVTIFGGVAAGVWLLFRLLAPATSDSERPAAALSRDPADPPDSDPEPEPELAPDDEVKLEAALARDPLSEESALHLADVLLTLELVVPPPSTEHATTWLMNQGPPQFGLMPHPAAVERVAYRLPAMVAFVSTSARTILVEAGVEVLLRSVEWRRAEDIHHLLIHLLGELGDESTLPILDRLAHERSFDDDEKKALSTARARIDSRLMARRGRLSLPSDGGELSLIPARTPEDR